MRRHLDEVPSTRNGIARHSLAAGRSLDVEVVVDVVWTVRVVHRFARDFAGCFPAAGKVSGTHGTEPTL